MIGNRTLITGIRGIEANFSDKDLFNISFYLTNLHYLGVINKREVVDANKVNKADMADESRVDRKEADDLGTEAKHSVAKNLASEDPSIALEDQVVEDLGIVLEVLSIEDLVIKDLRIVLKDPAIVEDSGIRDVIAAEDLGVILKDLIVAKDPSTRENL